MSRFYELLKRVELEKGARLSVEVPSPLLDLIEPSSEHPDPVPPRSAESLSQVLKKKLELEKGTRLSVEVPLPSLDLAEPPPVRQDAVSSIPGVHPPVVFSRFEELRERCARPTWHLDRKALVFSNAENQVLGCEQFRTLRSRLYRLREKKPLRALLVTSAVPGEGKTFVTANLVQAIVRQHERRALLIDVDLRRSKQHLLLGAPVTPGLTEYLRGEATETSVIQCGPQGNLSFIAAGKPVSNPTELIANGRLKSLIERLTPMFDWVILDSPPALLTSDAGILSGLCDGVLLVIRAATTPFDLAQRACQEFPKSLVGVVLNGTEQAALYPGYYNYYAGTGKGKK